MSAEEQDGNTEQWDFYFQHVDGEPASIMLDFAFDGYTPMEGFPRLTMIFVDMENPGEAGLGDAEEAEAFEVLEDKLAALLGGAGAYHVGRVRLQGRWHLSFYGPTELDLEELASPALEEASRDHAFVRKDDPDWNYYQQFLLPDDERAQWMSDRNTISALVDAGDHSEQPRSVEHWVYFRTADDRAAFVGKVEGEGFSTTPSDSEDAEWKLQVLVTRDDMATLEHLHKVVMGLAKHANAHSGWYSGWGCEVVAD